MHSERETESGGGAGRGSAKRRGRGGSRASSVIKFVWLANYDVVSPTPQWAGPARQEGQGQTEKDRERRCKEAGGNGIFSCAPDKFRQVFVVCRSQTDQSSDADRQRQRLRLQQKQQLRQRQRQRKSQLQLIARWIYQLKPAGESAPMRFGFASLFTAPSTHLSFLPLLSLYTSSLVLRLILIRNSCAHFINPFDDDHS